MAETKSLTEGACVIRNRMHRHAADTEYFGGIAMEPGNWSPA